MGPTSTEPVVPPVSYDELARLAQIEKNGPPAPVHGFVNKLLQFTTCRVVAARVSDFSLGEHLIAARPLPTLGGSPNRPICEWLMRQ